MLTAGVLLFVLKAFIFVFLKLWRSTEVSVQDFHCDRRRFKENNNSNEIKMM